MKEVGRRLYENTLFAVAIFVVSVIFIQENFPQHISKFTGSAVTVIGAIMLFTIYMLLRNQSLTQKVIFIAAYLSITLGTIWYKHYKNRPNTAYFQHEKQLFKGYWKTRIENLTVCWIVNDTIIKMNVDSANQQGIFHYVMSGDTVSCSNVKDHMFFDFQILKLTPDTLITLGDKGVQEYYRDR